MARPPEPIDGENADQAEARLKRLNGRFRTISSRLDGRSRRAGEWGVTPLEVVILLGLAGFVGWVGLQLV